jgi:hypothetical protein
MEKRKRISDPLPLSTKDEMKTRTQEIAKRNKLHFDKIQEEKMNKNFEKCKKQMFTASELGEYVISFRKKLNDSHLEELKKQGYHVESYHPFACDMSYDISWSH